MVSAVKAAEHILRLHELWPKDMASEKHMEMELDAQNLIVMFIKRERRGDCRHAESFCAQASKKKRAAGRGSKDQSRQQS
jgi:hypothetical protein